jgi:hypothetical protein
VAIKVAYRNRVVTPLEEVRRRSAGRDQHGVLGRRTPRSQDVGWFKAAEKSFGFWNNPAGAVYDTLIDALTDQLGT